ncbi:MAG: sugar phosphate isomerase/epimerase [Clostridia bacterium]|nr:sugar phosphate isomerase/epimerase [Clostridia bacterium]
MSNILICAPSRIYEDHPQGRFSYTAMVDYFASVGIGAIDMSFESLTRLDDSKNAVLYAAARRAKEKNIRIPVCHLSFYMPDPRNAALMAKYSRELTDGLDMAALMQIPMAVVHPIAWYSSQVSYGDWVRANMAFLSPVAEYAKKKGIKLCVENMPSDREAEGNHLYGSCALNISALAEKLGIGICWDVGHANVSGYKQSEQMQILKGKIDVLHIHDNGGKGQKDAHLLPFDGTVDWEDVAFGMRCCDFNGILDVEVTAWALSGEERLRAEFGGKALSRAKRLLHIAERIKS